MSTVDPSGATMSELNRRITLAERPVGQVASDCFATDEVEIPAPGPGEVLVKVGWLSIDPTIRGWMEGFIILDYMSRANEAIGELAGWVMGGDMKFAVDVVDGLDNAPAALDRLFTGANQGKVMVRL
jgi:NADPH-dependent curcumin reductase CurA